MITSPMPVKTCFQQRGLTLLETVLALAVGSIIIMAVLVYYQTASDNASKVATIKMVGDIGDAVRAYAQSPDYVPGKVNLSDLQSKGLLTGADMVNPWNVSSGSILVSTNNNYLGIRIIGVPFTLVDSAIGGICASLATQLSTSLPFPSPGTAKLNGITYTITTTSVVTATNTTSKTSYSFSGAAACLYDSTAPSTTDLSVIMDLS